MINVVINRDVLPPTNISGSSLNSCNSDGGIVFQFDASLSIDVVQYVVECTNDGCDQAVVAASAESTVVKGVLRAKMGRNYRLMMYGVDRCGDVSNITISTGVVKVENTYGNYNIISS